MGEGGVRLIHGDCLEVLPTLAAGSVDAVICDLPYGTTNCKWDAVIPFVLMWEQLRRITKPGGAIVLFGMQPFTSALIASNLPEFRYTWVWDKRTIAGHANARHRPLMAHEDIAVFGRGTLTYRPEMVERTPLELKRLAHRSKPSAAESAHYPGLRLSNSNRYDNRWKHPTTVIRIPGIVNSSREKVAHPTQKPIALMAYLMRTYTNPGETVLDFAAGSFTTTVAALREGRDCIGIEKKAEYFALGERRVAGERHRIAAAQPPLPLAAD